MAQSHAHAQKHQYHLVDPSPWPLLGAIAAGILATGGIIYMHSGGSWLLILGVLAVLAVMAGWWRDVIKEAQVEKAHTPVVQVGLRYGMALFITTEVMFFAAFFWAFFDASLFPKEATGGVWPPEGIETFDAFDVPLLNTMILLLSGTTLTWAHHSLLNNNRRDLVRGLGITVLLGIVFTGFQAFEYAHAAFGFTEGIYPSTFYMTTGFHGFHVLIGTIFLIVCFFRARVGHFTPEQHFGLEAAAWYWHFVDVVWLFLFVCMYWWGGN